MVNQTFPPSRSLKTVSYSVSSLRIWTVPESVPTNWTVDPEEIDALALLFDETSRDLVAAHGDWLGATFSANRVTGEIRVIARWRSQDSYEVLRTSDAYAAAMARFAPSFAGPPEIAITEVLVEM